MNKLDYLAIKRDFTQHLEQLEGET